MLNGNLIFANLLEHLSSFLKSNRVVSRLKKPVRIGVAVSGGADSVALLRLISELRDLKLAAPVVLHVDHQLRENSTTDALWVKKLAESLNLDFFSRKLTPPDKTARNGEGFEAWARKHRYDAFQDMARAQNLDLVCTGHTSDDQAETFLIRLLRGSSLQGLGGIRPVKKVCVKDGFLRLWRPLLNVSRETLLTMLKQLGQDWREDQTNKETRFFRNRVRLELLPIMESMIPGASSRICMAADDLRSCFSFVAKKAEKLLQGSRASELPLKAIPREPVMAELLKLFLIREGLGKQISRSLLERLKRLASDKTCGRKVCIGEARIFRTSEGLKLVNTAKDTVPELANTEVTLERPATLGGCSVLISKAPPKTGRLFISPEIAEKKLALRYRQPGDKIRLTEKMSKKLSEWMTDQKIPVFERDRIPLLATGSEIILVAARLNSIWVTKKTKPGWYSLAVKFSAED